MFSYCLFVVFAGGAALRDASGNVTDLIDGSMTGVNLECMADNYVSICLNFNDLAI